MPLSQSRGVFPGALSQTAIGTTTTGPLPGTLLTFGMLTPNAYWFPVLGHCGRCVTAPLSVFPQEFSLSGAQGLRGARGGHPAPLLGAGARYLASFAPEEQNPLSRETPHLFTPCFCLGKLMKS